MNNRLFRIVRPVRNGKRSRRPSRWLRPLPELLESRQVLSAFDKVLLVAADDVSNVSKLKTALKSTPAMSGVVIDTFDSLSGTPSLSLLQGYDAVLDHANYSPQ